MDTGTSECMNDVRLSPTLDTPIFQDILVQAQYWHDPLDETTYRARSRFLADINNERRPRSAEYRDNLLNLENFVMVKFTEDTVVDPKETEWFEFYAPGQAQTILPLKESPIYKEDWIGLKELDESGRLRFLSSEGNHLRFTKEFLREEIVKPFLLN